MKKLLILLSIFCFYSCGLNLFDKKKEVYKPEIKEKKWKPKKAVRSGNSALKVSGKIKTKTIYEPVQNTEKVSTKVEVTWVVPEVTVDGFILKYGFSKEVQDQEKKVLVKDLELKKDKDHGSVYKYVVENVPQGKDVFVRISAFLGDEVSEPSDVMKVMK